MPGKEAHGDAGKASQSHCPATGPSQEPTSAGRLPPHHRPVPPWTLMSHPHPPLATCSVWLLLTPPTATALASMATLSLDPSRDVLGSHAS